tara:strand:+ start:230 stop:445 length:216 start_codon:yes stop_codon:yes gene_type:complete
LSVSWTGDVVAKVDTCAFAIEFDCEVKINIGESVWVNEDSEYGHSSIGGPSLYLTSTESMSVESRSVNVAF